MTDHSCLFCKMVARTIPVKRVHEDDRCIAIEDINPQAPTHVLVMPRTHIATLNDLAAADEALAGHLLRVGAEIARGRGHADAGWRATFNVNRGAGQTVFHIHLHVLGGRPFSWPPG